MFKARLSSTHGAFTCALAFFLLLSGCAKKNANQFDAESGVHSISIQSVQHALKMTLEADIECPASGCHHAVGMLVGINESSLKLTQCTTTLIAPDIVLTNSHCIPDEVKKDQALCSERLKAVFPAAGGEEEVRNCKKLIKFSHLDEANESVDIALVQIEPGVKRAHLPWKRTGTDPKHVIQLLKIEPRADGFVGGRYNPEDCRLRPASLLVPEYQNRNSSILYFTDCKVNPGNSGSALLDKSDLTVSGVTYGHVPQPNVLEARESFRQHMHGNEDIPFANLGNNLRCLESLDGTIAADCVKKRQKTFEYTISVKDLLKDESLAADLDRQREKMLEDTNAALEKKFRVHSRPAKQISATAVREFVGVACVNSAAISADSPDELSFSVPAPELETHWGINRYFQRTLFLKKVGEGELSFAVRREKDGGWRMFMGDGEATLEKCE